MRVQPSFRSGVRAGLTQAQLAARLKSSQSRVAQMEAGDPTVSLDLLVRALFVIGTTPRQLASAIDRVWREEACNEFPKD